MKKETEKKEKVATHVNNNLPNYYIDNMRVSVREDQMSVINFFTDLPEGRFEQTRVITPVHRLKSFVDLICRQIDYYPVKAKEQKTNTSKTK